MAVLLGVLVALSFGTGDFFGGRASGQASVLGTLVISQTCAFVGAVVLVSVTAGTVASHDIALGALAGLVNVLGLGLLYGALARFVIGVVAPITAVVASLVPVTWGLLQGERPSVLSLCGVGLAIVAGALIARDPERAHRRVGRRRGGCRGRRRRPRGVTRPVRRDRFRFRHVAGLRGPHRGNHRGARGRPRTGCCGAEPRGCRTAARSHSRWRRVCSTSARRRCSSSRCGAGLIVLVAPIASLAPGFTVLLAWVVLGEQLGRVQRVGLLCALAGLVLVSTG